MELCCYNSYMESDVGALCHNYKVIQEFVGPNKKVVPILKANAYGFGDVEAAKASAKQLLSYIKERNAKCTILK